MQHKNEVFSPVSLQIESPEKTLASSLPKRHSLRCAMRFQQSFIDDYFAGEQVTVQEAFERVVGFGKFQMFSCLMNTVANMGAAFFLLAFALLEKEPTFLCQMGSSLQWKGGSEENTLQAEYCAGVYRCEVDWSNS